MAFDKRGAYDVPLLAGEILYQIEFGLRHDLVVIFELFGLNDVAVDTAVKFSAELGQRIDVERALDLLCQQIEMPPLDADSLWQEIHSIYASTSWRIAAPLRAIGNALKR